MNRDLTSGPGLYLEDVSPVYRGIISDVLKEFPDSIVKAFGVSPQELRALTWIPKHVGHEVTVELIEDEQEFAHAHFTCLYRWMLSDPVYDRIRSWLLFKRGGLVVPSRQRASIQLGGDDTIFRVSDLFDGTLSFEELEMNFSGDPFSFFICDGTVDQLSAVFDEKYSGDPDLSSSEIVFFIQEFDYTGWVVLLRKHSNIYLL